MTQSKKVLLFAGAVTMVMTLAMAPDTTYAGISGSHSHQTGEIIEVPIEETPVVETPVEETPIEETPVEETPVEETPIEETPVEETPIEETPVEETPVVVVPTEETPVVEVPVEETPVVVVPTEETPVAEVPVEETPAVVVPTEEAPAVVVPTEVPVVEAPIEETPMVTASVPEAVTVVSIADKPVARRTLVMKPIEQADEIMVTTKNTVEAEDVEAHPVVFPAIGIALALFAGLFIVLLLRNQVIMLDSDGNEVQKQYFFFLKNACQYLYDYDYRGTDSVQGVIRTLFQQKGKFLYAENFLKHSIMEECFEATDSQQAIISEVFDYEYPETTVATAVAA